MSDRCDIIGHVFDASEPDALLAEIETGQREESRLIARRLAAIAALLWLRVDEAETMDPDPGLTLITGLARTTAGVSAALNMSPMGSSRLVAQAEALVA